MTTIDRTLRVSDFGLVQVDGWPGDLIRIGQGLNGDGWSKLEHAFLYLGGGTIIQAEPGGAKIYPLSIYDKRNVRWSSGLFPDLTDQQRRDISNVARFLQGTGYSSADYFALAAHRFHMPIPGLKDYIGDSHRLICSQLVDLAYDRGGYHLFGNDWPGYVSPGRLGLLLAKRELALAA